MTDDCTIFFAWLSDKSVKGVVFFMEAGSKQDFVLLWKTNIFGNTEIHEPQN